MENRIYAAIDLKSFYASVECIERGLDPLTTNLVVADTSRTEKTICLAVSPSLKGCGISGRVRLFQVVATVRKINAQRKQAAPGRCLTGSSCDAVQLQKYPELALDYITAVPRMAQYMEYSIRIYELYLKYLAPEDIHVYSIDEVFLDMTAYLKASGKSPYDFIRMIIKDVLETTGITATAGIGTNLYLSKIAMDMVAKHVPPDRDGVRIAQLDEMSYRKLLWNHRPLTDFWRIGKGYARKLEANGLFTMGEIARCSVGKSGEYYNEALLYRLFGINAELLIDHAWGWEPCTMADIKAYKPETKSIGSGQVLQDPYPCEKARLVVREMADLLALDLVDQGMVTDQVTLTVGYDVENLKDPVRRKAYKGIVTTDPYGRKIPRHAHGTEQLPQYSSSARLIIRAVESLYDRITDKNLLVRRISLTANHVIEESSIIKEDAVCQLDMFTDYVEQEQKQKEEDKALEREKHMQKAILNIKKKFGKNALLKGMNLKEGATTRERNCQIGGHKA